MKRCLFITVCCSFFAVNCMQDPARSTETTPTASIIFAPTEDSSTRSPSTDSPSNNSFNNSTASTVHAPVITSNDRETSNYIEIPEETRKQLFRRNTITKENHAKLPHIYRIRYDYVNNSFVKYLIALEIAYACLALSIVSMLIVGGLIFTEKQQIQAFCKIICNSTEIAAKVFGGDFLC